MITCALTPGQVEKLYTSVYAHMDRDKNFNPEAYMQKLFNDIKSKKDAQTAAKFLSLSI